MVVASDGDRLSDAVQAVERTVDAVDRACSRFRDDSELSACNRAGGHPVRVSPLLLELVEAGVRAAALTDGDVDPTVGNALIALGYDADWETVASREPLGWGLVCARARLAHDPRRSRARDGCRRRRA